MTDLDIDADGSRTGVDQRSHADVADRITAVLNAAEEAGERICAAARKEAASILRQAHEVAAARVEELMSEPERLRAEAEEEARAIRLAAESHGSEQRRTADEKAREALAEAERQANAVRKKAQEDTGQIEEAGRKRQQEIADQVHSLEQVKQQALEDVQGAIEAYRDAVARLEQVVRVLLPAVDDEAPAGERRARSWRSLVRREPETPEGAVKTSAGDDESPSDDLYERAKKLGIRGRSKMSKDELEEAVRRAG